MALFLLVLHLVARSAGQADDFHMVGNTIADAYFGKRIIRETAGRNLADLIFRRAATLAIVPAFATKGRLDSAIRFCLQGVSSEIETT